MSSQLTRIPIATRQSRLARRSVMHQTAAVWGVRLMEAGNLLETVCEVGGVTLEDACGEGHAAPVLTVRCAFIYLCKRLPTSALGGIRPDAQQTARLIGREYARATHYFARVTGPDAIALAYKVCERLGITMEPEAVTQ